MKNVYLVLKRHIVKQTKSITVWSEWYLFGCDDCYKTLDHAIARVDELRQIAESKNFHFVDYRVQVLFLH